MQDHLAAGFVNRVVYDLWLLVGKQVGAEQADKRVRPWMIAHENEIMDQVVDPAVDQIERWFVEGVGA